MTETVELEILRNMLAAITAEMGVTLEHTARSSEVNVGRDSAVAIVDRAGSVAATDNPLQLGALAQTAADALATFKFDMKDGDVVLVSDPYRGGTHVQDVTLIAPHVVDNAIVLHLVARAHASDVGGQVAGSYFPTATEVWAEGVPFAPVKLQRHARPVRDVLSTVLLNSRRPEELRGNLDAQLACIEVGRRRVAELIGRYGVARVRDALTYAQDYTERRVADAIEGWRDGTFRGRRLLDHDCAGGENVAVEAEAVVEGDRLVLDLTASADARPSFVNSTRANTIGFALLPVLTLIGDDVPANGGVLRAVEVRTRPGSIVHALPPSAVGWSPSHCGLDVAEAAAAALRQAVPEALGALSAPAILAALRTTPRDHDRIDFGVWALGAGSAGGDCDGWGRPGVLSRGTVPSIEAWEVDTGVAVRSLEHVPDSGGAGRRRGAPALAVVFGVDREMSATFCVQGRANPVAGVDGGRDGAPAEVWVGGTPAPAVAVDGPLAPGELGLRFAGGAGYGDPMEREPELVAGDVADGYVSAAAARSVYGVVLREDNSVDAAATAALRRANR